MEEIKNKVDQAGLKTLSLEDYYPAGLRLELDIAPWLYEGVMLREKHFRENVKNHNWQQYQNAYVSTFCSADAIIPQWAYMLIGTHLASVAKQTVYGSLEVLETVLMTQALNKVDIEAFTDERIILKGCGHLPIPPHAYLHFVSRLQPVVKSLMFGEACSTVPIYKKPSAK